MTLATYILSAVLIEVFIRGPASVLFCPAPSLVGLYFLRPPGARAIFLHSNVLYWGLKHWGGDRIDPRPLMPDRVS